MTDSLSNKLAAAINKEKPLVDGDAIRKIAGKRIRDIYFKQSKDGSIKQLVIISTDYEAFAMTINNNDVNFFSSDALHEAFTKLLADSNMNTIYSGLIDPDFSEAEKVFRLFHTLWTKAISTDDYVKPEWTELGNILGKAGYRREK
jgi:hypothetical protein